MEKSYVPVTLSPLQIEKAKLLPSDVLAFVGDAVQTLYVRTRLANTNGGKIHAFHSQMTKEINATSQANALKNIEHLLFEDEIAVYKRCRNSHKRNVPKNSTITEYNLASGLEGIIGFLYLTGQSERINELVNIAYSSKSSS